MSQPLTPEQHQKAIKSVISPINEAEYSNSISAIAAVFIDNDGHMRISFHARNDMALALVGSLEKLKLDLIQAAIQPMPNKDYLGG